MPLSHVVYFKGPTITCNEYLWITLVSNKFLLIAVDFSYDK